MNGPTEAPGGCELFGPAPSFRRLMAELENEGLERMHLWGEPGTGKSHTARCLYLRRWTGGLIFFQIPASAFTKDLCRSLLRPDSALESPDRPFFLLLEGIEDLSPSYQCDLARRLQEGKGGGSRIFTTGLRSLAEGAREGRIHPDLVEAFEGCELFVPPLRERREDLETLARWFLAQISGGDGGNGFTEEALRHLQAHDWPANLAELKKVVEEAFEARKELPLGREDLRLSMEMARGNAPPGPPRLLPFDEEEKRILARALASTGGNVTQAAKQLRIGRATLYRKIHQYDLQELKPRRPRKNGGQPPPPSKNSR